MKDYSHCGKDVGARVGMTPEEHQKRHQDLHCCFDELMADFILHTNRLPSKVSLIELAEWSYKQTVEPPENASMKKYNSKEANKMLAAQLLADGLPEGPVCGGFTEDEIMEIRAMADCLNMSKSIRATLRRITSSIRGLTWYTLGE